MYPDAGDVQAPSPSPYTTPYAPGIGVHNDGPKPRHHSRRTSGRSIDIPFDAYGKHGHGQIPHDRFEKAYYEKHPELLKKETSLYHGPYAEDRPEWAMSSEDLNKIVRDTASRGAGIGKLLDRCDLSWRSYTSLPTVWEYILLPSFGRQSLYFGAVYTPC
jgi:hypothetical protein